MDEDLYEHILEKVGRADVAVIYAAEVIARALTNLAISVDQARQVEAEL